MTSPRYFYHNFPRRSDNQSAEAKGLTILESLAKSGLLLTPEKTTWSEFRQDGSKSPPVELFQKRACFTELAPEELPAHAKQFGPYAIEFEIESLRLLGAIPVFYLPEPGKEERALGGVAAALVARMADIQLVLTRLAEVEKLTATAANRAELIAVTLNGRPAVNARCTIGGAEDLIKILSHDTQPVQELLNAIRALAGFFYPTENLQYTGELAYYRQREWRIISAMMHRGREICRTLDKKEIEALLEIDRVFFEKRIRFPTGEFRRVDQCHYLSTVEGKPFLSWARRIVVPDAVVPSAAEVLKKAGLDIPISPISKVG